MGAGPVLAIDPGSRRCGIAVSDEAGVFAFPREVVAARGILERIEHLVEEEKVVEVVVGSPRTLRDEEGPAARRAARLAEGLAARLSSRGVTVRLFDERLSTVEAERAMREAGATAAARRGGRDAVAAALLLRAYLARRSRG